MADRYERYLMKQKLKEARHQAKLDAIRRKKELAEITNSKTKTIGEFLSKNRELSGALMFVIIFGFLILIPGLLIVIDRVFGSK